METPLSKYSSFEVAGELISESWAIDFTALDGYDLT